MSSPSIVEQNRRLYVAFDLAIDSALNIQGALPAGAAGSVIEPDFPPVSIGLGDTPSDSVFERKLQPYLWQPGQLLFDMPGVARYLCTDGKSIVVDPVESANAQAVEEMLVATALPALLWMRGELVLHACCFQPAGSTAAIAIAGPSGIGKSACIAQFYAQGAQIIADDVIRLSMGGRQLVASGLPCAIQTRTSADVSSRQTIHVSHDRVLVSADLAAIFVLNRGASSGKRPFVELQGVAALQALLAQRHRARAARLLGQEEATFKTLSALVATNAVKVFAWYRRDGDISLSDGEVDFILRSGETRSE